MFEINEDDILIGSPKSKFYDMIFNANKNIIKEILNSKIEEYAAMELLLSEIFGEEYIFKIREAIDNNTSQIEDIKNDFFINFTSDVLTKHE